MIHRSIRRSGLARILATALLVWAGISRPGALSAGQDVPYATDSAGQPLRSSSGLCWRTGFWTPAAAAAPTGLDGRAPGCACEADLLTVDACAGPPAAPPEVPVAPPTAPPPPAPEQPARAVPQKVKLSSEATFQFGAAVLDEASRSRLDALAEEIARIRLEVVLAVGHADRIGPDEYNRQISEKRATAVKEYLVGKGVPADRIYTEGKGEKQPRHAGECPAQTREEQGNARLITCLQADRRVEIEVIGRPLTHQE